METDKDESKCIHCKKQIVLINNRWLSDENTFPQYCWIDPMHGSQLHEPETYLKARNNI